MTDKEDLLLRNELHSPNGTVEPILFASDRHAVISQVVLCLQKCRLHYLNHDPIVQPSPARLFHGHSVARRWYVPSRFAVALSLTLVLAVRGWGQSTDRPSVDETRDGSAPSGKPTQQSSWKHTPNDDQPYVPLSLKHKAYLFGWRSIDPSAWIKSGVAAGLAQLRDSPEEWEQGTKGYGIRYGHRMLNRSVESGIGFGVAALLHQDGRYFRKPSAGVRGRVLHSVSQTFVTHTDNGGRAFSAWRVGGNYGAQFVSNAWRPESQRNAGDTMLRGTLSLGYDAASNLFKEFWPDIRRKIFKH